MRGVNRWLERIADKRTEDNLFYFCILLEYIARKTANRRSDVIRYFDRNDVRREMCLAEINRELTFDQVAAALIADYRIARGEFDTIRECRYTIPSVISIGRLYQQLVLDVCEDENYGQAVIDVFSSFISDEIADFNSDIFYRNPDYLKQSYLEGRLLE